MVDLTRHMRADMNPAFDAGLRELAAECLDKPCMVIAEIGVWAGESTRIFLETGNVQTMWAVDIWEDNYNPKDAWGTMYPMREVRAAFFDNVEEFRGHIFTFVMPSVMAANLAPDGMFDFVYIDANHDPGPFLDDLYAWKRKVKPGGWLAGHDYQGSWPGVIEMVDKFLGGPDMVYQDTSWVKRIAVPHEPWPMT